MIRNLIYNYYYKKFMKENNKDEKNIDWNKWNGLDRICEKLTKN